MKAAFNGNCREENYVDDNKIIELYWERKEDAIRETSLKYGSLCTHIAGNILSSHEVSVFARFSIPAWIYGVQGLCSVFVLARDRDDRHNVLHDDDDAEVPLFRFVARGG